MNVWNYMDEMMLIIITSKAETTALFIQAEELTYLHACQIDNYKWESEERAPESEWGIEFNLKDASCLTVKCGDEAKARKAEKNIPQFIYDAMREGDKVLWVELGGDDE
jgi:hypothetical protein